MCVCGIVKCQCECKKYHICEKRLYWNPAICNCENGKYLASIMDDLVIKCDEVIKLYDEETKTIKTFKTQNCYILLTFLLVTITLSIAVSICYYLIKY